MSYLNDCQNARVVNFLGAQPRLDPLTIDADHGLNAVNIQYNRGKAATRFGHAAVFAPAAVAASLYNWIYDFGGLPKNTLLYFVPGTGVEYVELASIGAPSTVMNQATAYDAYYANAGARIYAGFFDSNGIGVSQGQVFSFGVGTDTLFARPSLTTEVTFSSTEPTTGVNVAGLHRVGFYLVTRNGSITPLGPIDSGSTFAPFTFTASGGKNAQFTISPTGGYNWPLGATLQVIMTTSVNLSQYFTVPGANIAVAGTSPAVLTISISDDDLSATGQDVTDYQFWLSQNAANQGPFSPSVIFPYSGRMGYITHDAASNPVIYFSEPDKYQSLTADQHAVYLPGQLPAKTAQSLRGVCYIFGPHYTYAVSDSGAVPAQWAEPQLVDGSIGTLSPYGVCLNPSQGFIWVADEAGLYLFEGGVFPEKAISHYQFPVWQRINWGAAVCVKVADDKLNKRVHVLAPLDGATLPTHELVFDYTDGIDAETVKFSLNSIAAYSIRSIGYVQNDTTKHLEVWKGPGSASFSVLRECDGTEATPYRDVIATSNNQAITSTYETSLLPPPIESNTLLRYYHAAKLGVSGSGTLQVVLFSRNHTKQFPPTSGFNSVALSAAPEAILITRFQMLTDFASIQLTTAVIDDHFMISLIDAAFTEAFLVR